MVMPLMEKPLSKSRQLELGEGLHFDKPKQGQITLFSLNLILKMQKLKSYIMAPNITQFHFFQKYLLVNDH